MKDSAKQSLRGILQVILAVVLAVAIFASATLVAQKTHDSSLIAQSKVLRVLAKDDSVDIASMITDTSKRKVLQEFISALTNAYITFELIPYQEGETFNAVVASLNDDIEITNFAYEGKDFIIKGISPTADSYDAFCMDLSATQHFESVEGRLQGRSQKGYYFEIICKAKENSFTGILNR